MFCVMYYNLFDNFLVVPYGCIKKTQKVVLNLFLCHLFFSQTVSLLSH